ncbi:MAG TPA: GTPase HflX, partial [Candidatus Margulisiibacteriota bacterium]|nr:GTPase HflX [Candidatus Margulisiibacteriota bacterium]
MERALLVTIKLETERDNWSMEDTALELEELAAACGADILDNITCVRERPSPKFFIGSGKAEEISLLCQELNADTVVFSHDLSGTQQRNLEEVIQRKTIDRTQLILD